MSDLIFGLTREQIQLAQQKKEYRQPLVHTPNKSANQADIDLLETKGLKWLEENQYYGVIDRLKTSKLV